jgi:ABC-type antimicrobial peptide transport system permease subunit
MFGKEFIRLLLIAFVVTAPFAWWVMNNWLETFAYRIQIRPVIFILAILITSAVAVIAVGYKSIMAALMNPVKSLRSE